MGWGRALCEGMGWGGVGKGHCVGKLCVVEVGVG